MVGCPSTLANISGGVPSGVPVEVWPPSFAGKEATIRVQLLLRTHRPRTFSSAIPLSSRHALPIPPIGTTAPYYEVHTARNSSPHKTMGRPHLTDDERLRVRVLRHDANFTFARISQITGYGERQIRNALKSPTVGKRSGRPTALSPAQEAELVRFVTASKENRSMTYADIGKALFDGAHGEYAIRNTLRRLGFKRSGPVLKQMTREGEKTRGDVAPAAGASLGRGTGIVGAATVVAGPMEGVGSTKPGATRADNSADDDEMITDDEGHAGVQARGEGESHTESQAHGWNPAYREGEGQAEGHGRGKDEGQANSQARGAVQDSAEERVSTAVAAAVSVPATEDVTSRALEAAQTGATKAGDADNAGR